MALYGAPGRSPSRRRSSPCWSPAAASAAGAAPTSTAPASTAAAGTRVAPANAPYAFVAPGGFAPTTVHPEDMKAGSHIDLVSFYDKPTVDGLTTLGVMAFDAGEPVTDDPITLGSRFWREIGPGGSNPPPITAGVLGGLPAFEVAFNAAAGEAPTRTTYRGAAVGSWVVVATCTGAGPAAIAGLDRACRNLTSTVELSAAPRAALTSAPVTSEAGAPYTFAAPDGFTISDPAIVRAQLGGVPALARAPLVGEPRAGVRVRRRPAADVDRSRPRSAAWSRRSCRARRRPRSAGTGNDRRRARRALRRARLHRQRRADDPRARGRRPRHRPRDAAARRALLLDAGQRSEAQAGCQSVLGSLAFR